MTTFFIGAGIALFLLMLVALYRVIVGPTVMTRIIAANMIGTKTTVLLLIIGAVYDRLDMFVDLAMTYALLNFIGTLAVAKYFFRNKRVDIDDIVTETPP